MLTNSILSGLVRRLFVGFNRACTMSGSWRARHADVVERGTNRCEASTRPTGFSRRIVAGEGVLRPTIGLNPGSGATVGIRIGIGRPGSFSLELLGFLPGGDIGDGVYFRGL